MLERGRDSIEEEEKVEQLPADGLEGEQQAEYYCILEKGGGVEVTTWYRV